MKIRIYDNGYRPLTDTNNNPDSSSDSGGEGLEYPSTKISIHSDKPIDCSKPNSYRIIFVMKCLMFFVIFAVIYLSSFVTLSSNNSPTESHSLSLPVSHSSLQLPEELKDYTKWLIDTPACRIPASAGNIFDTETLKFFSLTSGKPWNCLTNYTIMPQIRRINYTSIQLPEGHEAYNCTAHEILRSAKKENFVYGTKVYKLSGKNIHTFDDSVDSVEVRCRVGNQTESKVIPLIPVKQPQTGWFSSQNIPADKPNILLFGIDSVSRLNFHRQLLKTKEFVEQKNFIEFFGHHKVGDNSFPNIIPMMIGDLVTNWTRLWNKDRKLDALPLIFERFQQAGYLTTYIEDMVRYGLFTYHLKNGFYDQPTDYFPRPTSIIIEQGQKSISDACYQDRLQTEIYYDYLLEMFTAMRERDQKLYAHIHLSTISHNYVNWAGYIDQYSRDFLERFFASDFHKNTIIIVYADHPIRFGPSVRTKIAYYETKLPFFQIYIPDSLKLLDVNGDKLSADKIKATLKENSRKLTSHMDIHATMLHVLNGIPDRGERYGQSLFLPVSENRKCSQAGIPDEYCACHSWFPATDAQIDAQLLASRLVEHINSLLTKNLAKCLPLTLNTIESISIRDDSLNMSRDMNRQFQIDFTTLPNNGTFHVTLKVNGSDHFVGSPTIERHDIYGSQSKCVAGSNVEMFCMCRETKNQKKKKG